MTGNRWIAEVLYGIEVCNKKKNKKKRHIHVLVLVIDLAHCRMSVFESDVPNVNIYLLSISFMDGRICWCSPGQLLTRNTKVPNSSNCHGICTDPEYQIYIDLVKKR